MSSPAPAVLQDPAHFQLLALPPELLIMIAEKLEPATALALTCSYLYATIPAKLRSPPLFGIAVKMVHADGSLWSSIEHQWPNEYGRPVMRNRLAIVWLAQQWGWIRPGLPYCEMCFKFKPNTEVMDMWGYNIPDMCLACFQTFDYSGWSDDGFEILQIKYEKLNDALEPPKRHKSLEPRCS